MNSNQNVVPISKARVDEMMMHEMDKPSVVLGGEGTFSYEALIRVAETFGAPTSNIISVDRNDDVIPAILNSHGYGVLATRTDHGGRVQESYNAYLELFRKYGGGNEECPVHIIASLRLPINFCIATRRGVALAEIEGVVAHDRAIQACRDSLVHLCGNTVSVANNKLAAEKVANDPLFASYAAIAPRAAMQMYDLEVHDMQLNDIESPAVTTFNLIAPSHRRVYTGKNNKALLMFSLPNKPLALLHLLLPIGEIGINAHALHSTDVSGREACFMLELDIPDAMRETFAGIRYRLEKATEALMIFGPYEVFDG